MGRGVLSRSIRSQNRANESGNCCRGNPCANNHAGYSRNRRKQLNQREWERNTLQKYLLHDNKNYRVAYRFHLDEGKIEFLGAVHYPNPLQTDGHACVLDTDLLNILAKRLLITLMVEEEQKNQ